MRIIATQDYECGDIVLVNEQEFISTDEELKCLLHCMGKARLYDDTQPLPPKGVGIYEVGKKYPYDRFMLKDGNLYQAEEEANLTLGKTSDTFILSEWKLIIEGQ